MAQLLVDWCNKALKKSVRVLHLPRTIQAKHLRLARNHSLTTPLQSEW
jgi:hypothetical protein